MKPLKSPYLSSKRWRPKPGGHAFVHFHTIHIWQSHPFSFVIGGNDDEEIMFYIKVKDGITKTLYNRLSQCPGKISTIPVMVEGPYGGNSPGQRCRHLVYVAGGNGIPGLYSECIDVDRRAPENKTIKLVWVVRNWKSVTWFADELKRLKVHEVQAMVFVTRPDDLSGFDSSSNKALKQPYQYEKESVEK